MNKDVEVSVNADRFSEIEWQQVAPDAKQKLVDNGEKRVRLLELSAGFREKEWCLRGHTGYIISGSLNLEFNDGRQESFDTGDLLIVSPGQSHKAHVVSGTTRLFLVDDV